MTFNAPVITAYFDLTAQAGDFWIWDDPDKGWDQADSVWAGDVGTTLTSDGVHIHIERGRDQQLEDIATGVATIQFNNHDRQFDPFHVGGDYYGKLVPKKRIGVSVLGFPRFTGRVEDWEVDYAIDGDAVATVSVLDWLGTLAAAEFDEWTTTGGQTAGPRLDAVLNRSEVAFPGGPRAFDTGYSTLQADLVTWGSNVLNYCQLVTRSEQGTLYDSAAGVLTLRDRRAALNDEVAVIFADGTVYDGVLTTEEGEWLTTEDGEPLLAEDATSTDDVLPFHGVKLRSASDLLYTSVSVDAEGFDAQTATDDDAVEEYGGARLGIPGLLLDSEQQCQDMADFLLAVYKTPAPSIASITVKVHALSDLQQSKVLALDLTSVVRVVWRPRGVGDPIDRFCVVQGIDEDIAPMEHVITFHLADAYQRGTWIWDDPIMGVWGGPGVWAF